MSRFAIRGPLGAVLALVLVAGGCASEDETPRPRGAGQAASDLPTPDQEQLSDYYDQEPAWAPCEAGFECAEVEVPLDYSKPDGKRIKIAVNRSRATGDRLGALLLNPGGPGASGLDYARFAKSGQLGQAVQERYDLVGFDPRGVGKSSPIDCVTDSTLDEILAVDGTPANAAEEQALLKAAEHMAKGCATKSPDLVANVGTRQVARDLDIVRDVVGDEKLNYLGSSYGTFLGALYAEYFPDRVGRMVLDGAVDPRASGNDVGVEQAKGFELALRNFVEDCGRHEDCPLPDTVNAGMAEIRAMLKRIDTEPLPTDEGREVTEALATLGLATAMYQPEPGWEILRSAIAEVQNDGVGDRLLALADVYANRGPNGYTSNSTEALAAVSCIDRPSERDINKIRQDAERLAGTAATLGSYLGWSGLVCARWEAPPQGEPGPLTAEGAAPILVVGTTRDPATPLVWAQGLAEQLDSGVLLIREGDGHLAYGNGNACIDSTIEAYLIGGDVPEDGKRC